MVLFGWKASSANFISFNVCGFQCIKDLILMAPEEVCKKTNGHYGLLQQIYLQLYEKFNNICVFVI